jgi:hypothetical protein
VCRADLNCTGFAGDAVTLNGAVSHTSAPFSVELLQFAE